MASTTLPPSVPPTHPAVAITGVRQPLSIISEPTTPPSADQVLVHVQWTSSSPLELHEADGGLLLTPDNMPFILGGCYGGVVAALGPTTANSTTTRRLRVGDKVFGFAHAAPSERGFQTYITTASHQVSKLPPNLTLAEAVTVPTNLVTAIHATTTDLGLPLPWPVPPAGSTTPPVELSGAPILVWGAASSVGLFALQVYKHWGYGDVIAVAAGRHHEMLAGLGARHCVDYQLPDAVEQILALVPAQAGTGRRPRFPYILDCIGSLEGTLRPLTRIAERGSRVAVMLPMINVHACDEVEPQYEMDVANVLEGQWREGVELKGVRTHFYQKVSQLVRLGGCVLFGIPFMKPRGYSMTTNSEGITERVLQGPSPSRHRARSSGARGCEAEQTADSRGEHFAGACAEGAGYAEGKGPVRGEACMEGC